MSHEVLGTNVDIAYVIEDLEVFFLFMTGVPLLYLRRSVLALLITPSKIAQLPARSNRLDSAQTSITRSRFLRKTGI